MTELQEALATLRREVEASAAADATGSSWRLGRIHLRLGLEWVQSPEGHGSWCPAGRESPHSVELEWVRGEAITSGTGTAVQPVPQSSAVGATSPLQRLEAAFGPPGFDSAARATVFREVALEIGAEAVVGLLEALIENRTVADPDIDRSRHGVRRLLERGPAGVGQGARILLDVFRQFPGDSILQWIGAHWRYGTDHDLGGGR